MQKQAPGVGKILTMAAFTLSCFGLLTFLWLSFGGPLPLNPQGYRFEVAIPEAATLTEEADVRLAGINVGRVKGKQLEQPNRTLVEIEIDSAYAPIPEDTRAILRQKTLLGETYVELTPGDEDAGDLADGGRLEDANVDETVEVDEILSAFDEPTRQAFQTWVAELEKVVADGRGQDFNDALGNLPGFAESGADVLEVLDTQEQAVTELINNTGQVFRALGRREGQLASLIRNGNDVFEATASRDDALAETFAVFPTFLDESRFTLDRLEGFSRRTRPLVRELEPVADDLGPTVRDVGDLAPDLENLFRDLDPLIEVSDRNLPRLEKILREAGPLFEGLFPFLEELNPILSFANFDQRVLALFFQTGGATLNGGILSDDPTGEEVPERYVRGFGIINAKGLSLTSDDNVPPDFIGNTYPEPNAYERAPALGAIEAFTCAQTGEPGNGERPDAAPGLVPCFVKPPSLYGGTQYPRLGRGEGDLVAPPAGGEGSQPADPSG
ncbi:MAG: MlaD family protein [Thermoleophilaceae bacterium]